MSGFLSLRLPVFDLTSLFASCLLVHSTSSTCGRLGPSSSASRWSCWYFLLKKPNCEEDTIGDIFEKKWKKKKNTKQKLRTQSCDSHLPQQSHDESQQQQTTNDTANNHPHRDVGRLPRFSDCQRHLHRRSYFKACSAQLKVHWVNIFKEAWYLSKATWLHWTCRTL